jgi:hypothetical protein
MMGQQYFLLLCATFDLAQSGGLCSLELLGDAAIAGNA